MSENERKIFLKIKYIADNAIWFHKILKTMNSTQKQKYIKTFLPSLSRSISRKLKLIEVLLKQLDLEMKEIDKELKKNMEEVNNCIKKNTVFSFKDDNPIFRVVAYIEAVLIEMKSAADLIIKYISKFFTYILLERKGEKSVIKELVNNNINLEWKHELNYIRRGFIHHYSGWISFEKRNNCFRPTIDLPKSIKRFKDYEKFPYVFLGVEKINDILNNFKKFNDEAFNFLVKRIQESAR